ncbi:MULTISPECIES: cyclopropane-fatty-acyl-phospholipid synthase family protein [unclassified Crossiella]|uniref:SAM-dependent methyltransferase n=1 Tax=unclassified Crossiella TaxID=2620835 RepID=UPI001FFF6200|nr:MULTISPECIES: class I SAM-dependent methyltransferase [unclassified Crossiella]MCK2244115.1 methyltransferase domain-containing protein [Crossiella sp. S99.2]MCK2257919.1 methyltransferase domain-containing protein [Crossiella sp. S99.1]
MSPDGIADSYNDSSVLFRVLGAVGWGDLVNVGYLTWPTLPLAIGGLGRFQRRLVRNSLALLEARPGEVVLDACCGRGLTTAWLARQGCQALGVDIQPEQIAEASARFGQQPGARFAVADVTAPPPSAGEIDLSDGALDRIHCLEAAFHFGPAGRQAFLTQAHRLLRPGGRLVLVDFTWREADPSTIETLDPDRLVRDTWHFEQFEPLERYLSTAAATGFTVRAVHDWTPHALAHYGRAAPVLRRILSTRAGRWAACRYRPALAGLTEADWRQLIRIMDAHMTGLVAPCRYTALVLDKPA